MLIPLATEVFEEVLFSHKYTYICLFVVVKNTTIKWLLYFTWHKILNIKTKTDAEMRLRNGKACFSDTLLRNVQLDYNSMCPACTL